VTWVHDHEVFVPSRGDNDNVSVELLADSAAGRDCLEVIGVKEADDCGCGGGVDTEVPAKSARNLCRNACGVAPEYPVADSCSDGLTLGVVLRELLKSH